MASEAQEVGMLKEFKEFVAKGSAIDLAVGVVIGAAFGAIVKSLVDGLIMPLVGLLLGRIDLANLYLVLGEGTPAGPYATLKAAQDAGAPVLAYGLVINAFVSFLIIAFVVFLVIKAVNVVRKPVAPPAMKDCPFCLTSVPGAATRCPACTGQLAEP
jgi:large conductance mechanosensitive channel